MNNLIKKLFVLLYDNQCLICKEVFEGHFVCKNCEMDFKERKTNHSKYFGALSVYSWAYYEGKLRDGIIKLKNGEKKLVNYFCSKLVDFWGEIKKEILNNEHLVIPTPSHKNRIKERGYCQSSLICKEFAKILKLNFSSKFISRIKDTKHMNSLQNVNDRFLNIKDAFKVIGPKPRENNLIIIDDILTSGSTICELARTIHCVYPELNIVGLTIASGDTYT